MNSARYFIRREEKASQLASGLDFGRLSNTTRGFLALVDELATQPASCKRMKAVSVPSGWEGS